MYNSIQINFLKFYLADIKIYLDYCISLAIYYPKHLIDQLEKLYNYCLFKLCNIKLSVKSYKTFIPLDLQAQSNLLKDFNLMPLRYRLFYRLSLFSYKILNRQILLNIFSSIQFHDTETLERQRKQHFSLCATPNWRTYAGTKRLSYFLPNFVNVVLKNSFNLSFNDFNSFITDNLRLLYDNFCKVF